MGVDDLGYNPVNSNAINPSQNERRLFRYASGWPAFLHGHNGVHQGKDGFDGLIIRQKHFRVPIKIVVRFEVSPCLSLTRNAPVHVLHRRGI